MAEPIQLSYILSVYFNTGSCALINEHLAVYSRYPAEILDRIQFVIIDDGSPTPVTIDERLNLNVLLLRIEEDIPWNQPGAKNLGVVYARSEKIFLTDMDVGVPVATLQEMITCQTPDNQMYGFRRQENGQEVNPHENVFLMSRSQFLKAYGYDEEFCGHHGYDDTYFLMWQKYNGAKPMVLPLWVVSMNITPARSHTLGRDSSHNQQLMQTKACHSRKFLNFHWKTVADLRRISPAAPEPLHPGDTHG